jgi:hypothetical protein
MLFGKGNGKPGPGKHRWLMQMSNGQRLETRGYYSYREICRWECSLPVKRLN